MKSKIEQKLRELIRKTITGKLTEAKFKDIDVKKLGKKKTNDLMIYLFNIVRLELMTDMKTDTKKQILSVNISKITPKVAQNIQKQFGVDLTEGKLTEKDLFKIFEGDIEKKVDTKVVVQRMLKNFKGQYTWVGKAWAKELLGKYKKGISQADFIVDAENLKNTFGGHTGGDDIFKGLNEGKLTEIKTIPSGEIQRRMRKSKYWKKVGLSFEREVGKKFRGKKVSEKALDKMLPDYIDGKQIHALFIGAWVTDQKEGK